MTEKFEVVLTLDVGDGDQQVTKLITDGLLPVPTLPFKYGYKGKGGDYAIVCRDSGEYLVLVMPFEAGVPAAKYEHPNIVRSRPKTLEFKHSDRTGRKWWTRKPGVEKVVVVPRSQAQLKVDPQRPRLSFVATQINGVEVVLNVSGGGGAYWTDWFGTTSCTVTSYPLATLKAVLEVAVRGTPHEPFRFYDEKESAYA